MGRLTAFRVKSVKAAGKTQRLSDGDGLYLVVRPNGSKSWVLRVTEGRKRRDRGLGGFPAVSLRMARDRAAALRDHVEQGRGQPPTFKDMAEEYIEVNEPTWRHPKTAIDARSRLSTYAYPIFGHKPVDRINRRDVLRVLLPIWTAKPACSRKLRQRLRGVFDLAIAMEWREDNPAGDALKAALPKTKAIKRHFRALPYHDVREALNIVEGSPATVAVKLLFRFTILTAARSGESRVATWNEIDLEARTWTVPAEKMKSERPHRVPLSGQALEVLDRARALHDEDLVGDELIFKSDRGKTVLSNMTLTKVLRDNGLADKATMHGFRSSFRDWTMEQTATPWAVAEAALAHTVGNSTEQAYARSDLFDRRRDLMQEWGDYLG